MTDEQRGVNAALEALDNSRRVGWARAYAAEKQARELRGVYDATCELLYSARGITLELLRMGRPDVAEWVLSQEDGASWVDYLDEAWKYAREKHSLAKGAEILIEHVDHVIGSRAASLNL